MTINLNAVIKMCSLMLVVMALAFTLPIVVAFIYGETFVLKAFAVVALPCFVIGLILLKFFNPRGIKAKGRDGYIIVTACWLLASLIGAIPVYLCGAIGNPIDAFFELCSGFSTTGASIVEDVEGLPKAILMWRSFTHWLGGMGIIVFAAALIPSIGIGGQVIASAETPGPVLTKINARFSDTAKNLYRIYLFFTIVETGLLMLGGMNLFDSLLHTFGTVGTGGFSSYGNSIAHFSSPYLQWVIIIFMILCGINFNLYYYLIKGRIKEFFQDEELKLYLGVIIAFSAFICINLWLQGGEKGFENVFRESVFQVSSIITTTGYATANYDIWPTFSKILLMFLMITGACASSTGGGVKFIRILIALKYVKRGFFMKLHPNRVGDITVNSRGVSQSVVSGIISFLFFYISILFAGVVLISIDGYDMVTNFSAVLTCLGNVGPGFNLVGPTLNFSIYSNFSTLVLSLLMIAGRLELFTFFLIFSSHYWNSNKV